MSFCAASHFYLMGVINGGYERSDASFNDPRFIIPMVRDIEDPELRDGLAGIEQQVAPAVEPWLPWCRHLVNWQEDYLWQGKSINFADKIEIDPQTQQRVLTTGQSHNVPPLGERFKRSFTNGNFVNSFAIWSSISLMFWTSLGTLFRGGPFKGPYRLLTQPFRFAGCFLQTRVKNWAALLIGTCFGAMLVRGLGFAPQASIMAALGGAMVLPTPFGTRLARLGFTLIPGPMKGWRSCRRLSLRTIQLVLVASPAGMALATFVTIPLWVSTPLFVVGLALLFSVAIRNLLAKPGTRRVAFLVGGATFIYLGLFEWVDWILADDGGRAEFGSATFPEWMMSDGGIEVGIHSVTGTAGTALGPLASGIRGGDPLPEEVPQSNQLTSIRVMVDEASIDE